LLPDVIVQHWPELEWRARLAATIQRFMPASSTAPPLHASGIPARTDDAEVAARLLKRRRIDVRLGGRLLDGTHRLGAMGERIFEEALVRWAKPRKTVISDHRERLYSFYKSKNPLSHVRSDGPP
jgi:hypothetical protein